MAAVSINGLSLLLLSVYIPLCCDNKVSLILPMLRLFLSKHKDAKILENNLNPVMLVFIGKLSLSTLI